MAGEVRPPLHLLFSVGPTQEFENAAGHYPKQAGAFVGLHSEFPDREGIVKHAEGEMSERGEMQSGSFELDCISQGTGRGPQENQHLISPVDGASEIGMPQPGSVEACGKSDEQKLSAVSGAVEVSAVATAGLPSFVALQLLDCPTQETGGSERNGGVPGRAAECEPQPRETKDFPQGMACRTSGTPNQTEGPPEEAKLLRIGPAIKDRNEEAGKEGGEREGEERRELGEEEREGEVPAESERPCETRDDALNQAVPEERWRLPFSQGLTQVEARESWGLGRSGRLENEVPVEEQSKWGGVAAVATKESEAAGEGVNTGALRRGECGQEKMAGDVSERGELAENGEAANFGFFIDRENDLTSERDAGCPEGEFVGERKGVTFDLSLDLRMSLAETQDHATSLPALEEEEGALNGEIGVKGGRRAGPNGEPGGEACQPDAGRNSGEQPGSTLEQPTEVHLRIAEENGPPLALPERGPTDGQIASVDRPPPRPVPEAADVTVAATPEHVEGEHTPVRCPNPKREGRNAEGGSALGGGDALEEGGEPGPITSARRAVGMAVTSSEVMLIERFLAGEDLSGTEEKDPFQLAYVGGVKIRLKRRSLGLDEFRLGGVASETETEGEEDLLADLQTQAAAEGGGIAEGVGEQGGGLGETGAGVQLEGVTTGEEQETEGNLRDSVDNGMPTRAERRGGAEEGGGCCLREATGRLDEDMLGACGAVGGNGVDGAGVYDTGFAERIGGEGLNAGVLGSGEVVGHREQIAKLRLGSDSVEPRMDTAEKCHVAERQGRESGSDAAGVVSSPKVTVAEVHPRSDGSSGHEELDTQMVSRLVEKGVVLAVLQSLLRAPQN